MGVSFGGKSSKSQPSDISKTASGILFELLPGLSCISHVDQDLGGEPLAKLATQMGIPVESLLSSLQSKFPSIQSLQEYNTIFEKYNQGKLTPFENQVFESLGNILSTTTPIGGNVSSIGGNVQSPKFEPPPDIGTLTKNIMKNLPPQMKTFINNIFQDSSPEAIQAELDNFAESLRAEAEQNAESLGGQLMSKFSALGLGTSGTAMENIKQLGLEIATNVNKQIAEARLNMLNTLLNARQIGVNLVETLGKLGASEQANLVAGKVAELNAQADIIQSQIQAQAMLQANLIDAQTRLQAAKMGLTGDIFKMMLGESAQEEATRLSGAMTPYNILLSLATNVPPLAQGAKPQTSIGLGGDFLSGIADIASLFK